MKGGYGVRCGFLTTTDYDTLNYVYVREAGTLESDSLIKSLDDSIVLQARGAELSRDWPVTGIWSYVGFGHGTPAVLDTAAEYTLKPGLTFPDTTPGTGFLIFTFQDTDRVDGQYIYARTTGVPSSYSGFWSFPWHTRRPRN